MAIVISVSAFPNVPRLPGVPQLVRSLLFPPTAPPSLGNPGAAGALWQSTQTAPMWGIFDQNNKQVVTQDSVMDFGYRHATNLPDYPIQNGAFGSFNRVSLPFENFLVLTKGGSVAERNAFLAQIDAIDTGPGALLLYTILTPEKSYSNVNVSHVELTRRGARDATFFDVEIRFRQIFPVSAQYSTAPAGATPTDNAQAPGAVPFSNQGLVQPQPLSFGSQQAIDSLFTNSILNKVL